MSKAIAAWMAVLTPGLLVGALRLWEGPGPTADDYAHHLLHARALLEGRAYGDTGYLYSPYNRFIGPESQPPGLPLTLAPLLAVFGSSLSVPRALMLVCLGAFVLLAGLYFAAEDRALGLAVALVTGVALPLADQARYTIGPDLGFAALLWGVFLLSDRAEQWGWGRTLAITGLGLVAFTYRLAAVPLVPALLVFAALRFRQLRFRPALPALAWGMAFLLLTAMLPTARPFVEELQKEQAPLARVAQIALEYRWALAAAHLVPFGGDRPNDVYHAAAALLMMAGLWAWIRRPPPRLLVFFAVFYVGMLVVLPRALSRYLWPLFPLLAFGLLWSVRAVVRRLTPAWSAPRQAAVTLGVAALAAGMAAWQGLSETAPAPLYERGEVRELFAHLQQIQEGHEPRVVFFKPRSLAWFTGLPAMGVVLLPPDRAIAELRACGITHVVVGDLGLEPEYGPALEQLVAAQPEAFALTFRNSSFAVFRLREGAAGPAAGRSPPDQAEGVSP